MNLDWLTAITLKHDQSYRAKIVRVKAICGLVVVLTDFSALFFDTHRSLPHVKQLAG
jgi:hypothetical protein